MVNIAPEAVIDSLYSDQGDLRLFGTTHTRKEGVKVFSFKVRPNGHFSQDSLQVSRLTSGVSVTGVLPHLKNGKMHMMV